MFEGYERRIDKINAELQYGFKSIEQTRDYCLEHGVDVASIVRGIQPIAFENAVWAYTLGAAIALKSGGKSPSEAARNIGVGLQAFCIPGSVADSRKVGLGHGNLAAMLLDEKTECFCSASATNFAAAVEALSQRARCQPRPQKPLRVILNGLSKDAAYVYPESTVLCMRADGI